MVNSAVPSRQGHTGALHFRNMVIAFGACAAVALALSIWRYLTPLSGVTGASGMLLAMLGELALVVAAVVLLTSHSRGIGTIFIALSWLGGVLTLLALAFLHGWFAALALLVGMLALAGATVLRGKEGTP